MIKIFKRYGFTKKQLHELLNIYINLMHSYNCIPTFPITACILKRYPELAQEFNNKGVEFAVHGYIHSDYTRISSKRLLEHFEKAIEIFNSLHIPFTGFRYPYLKWNEEILQVIAGFDFCWDSSQAVMWDFFYQDRLSQQKRKNYQKILAQYKPYNARNYIIRPKLKHNFVEIPVALPDDDMMIDRLGIVKKEIIEEIWVKILEDTYRRGELFTLQLHPERINFCGDALESVLKQARSLNPPIWIAPLGEIAKWWKEKKNFKIQIDEQQQNRYQVKVTCSKRATILIKNSRAINSHNNFIDGYQIINDKVFFIESSTKPVVGIAHSAPKALQSLLKEEGIPFEVSHNKTEYGTYLSNYDNFTQRDEIKVIEAINRSGSPLVRFWRWPEKARSALAITGDIDAITSVDYLMRVLGR